MVSDPVPFPVLSSSTMSAAYLSNGTMATLAAGANRRRCSISVPALANSALLEYKVAVAMSGYQIDPRARFRSLKDTGDLLRDDYQRERRKTKSRERQTSVTAERRLREGKNRECLDCLLLIGAASYRRYR
jgi:hypothetical protein